jgi:hypothetical protein
MTGRRRVRVPPASHRPNPLPVCGSFRTPLGFRITRIIPLRFRDISGPATVGAARGRGTRSLEDRDA